MIFKKIRDNHIDSDKVEILNFNYDGKGTALVKKSGKIDTLGLSDLNFVMFGDNEEKYYKLMY